MSRLDRSFYIGKGIPLTARRPAYTFRTIWRSNLTTNVALRSTYSVDVTSIQQEIQHYYTIQCTMEEQSSPFESHLITNMDLHLDSRPNIRLGYYFDSD